MLQNYYIYIPLLLIFQRFLKMLFLRETLEKNNKKKIRYIKSEIIKNMFLGNDSKRVIHWKLWDIISNDNNKGNKKNGIKKRISFSRISEQKCQAAYIDTGKNQNIKNKIPKRKNSMSGVGVMTQIESESTIANRKFNASNTENKLFYLVVFL